jgi:hypothetical protein
MFTGGNKKAGHLIVLLIDSDGLSDERLILLGDFHSFVM